MTRAQASKSDKPLEGYPVKLTADSLKQHLDKGCKEQEAFDLGDSLASSKTAVSKNDIANEERLAKMRATDAKRRELKR